MIVFRKRKAKLKTFCFSLNEKIPDDLVFYNKDGEIHRVDGPAIITVDGIKYWYIHGKNITSKVNHWIQEMDMPKYDQWNDGHKALFKLTFG